ncbi:MAG TPA: hypothetical protein DDW50_12595, partial [Firmicutes bacterium]|nr:hypothetical protein [Bacillota bacterium]
MKQPKFGPLYLACGLFMVIVVFFMIYVNYFVKKVTNVDSLAANLDSRKFQGLLIEKKALADPNNHFLFSWLHAYQ